MLASSASRRPDDVTPRGPLFVSAALDSFVGSNLDLPIPQDADLAAPHSIGVHVLDLPPRRFPEFSSATRRDRHRIGVIVNFSSIVVIVDQLSPIRPRLALDLVRVRAKAAEKQSVAAVSTEGDANRWFFDNSQAEHRRESLKGFNGNPALVTHELRKRRLVGISPIAASPGAPRMNPRPALTAAQCVALTRGAYLGRSPFHNNSKSKPTAPLNLICFSRIQVARSRERSRTI